MFLTTVTFKENVYVMLRIFIMLLYELAINSASLLAIVINEFKYSTVMPNSLVCIWHVVSSVRVTKKTLI